MDESGASAPIMFLPNMVASVKDFEIYGENVYFCGETNNGIGILGRFKLSDFPAAQVYIWNVPSLATMNKLDVKELNSVLHVLMTGESALGSQHLVDAFEPSVGSATWVFYVSKIDTDWLFDDVAITSSKVVFSGRHVVDNNSGVIYFSFPSSLASVLSSNADYQIVPALSTGNGIVLVPSVADNFAFATSTSSGLFVGEYNSYTKQPIWQNAIGGLFAPQSLDCVDLAYNTLSSNLDIVTKPVSVSVPTNILHTFNSPIMPSPPLLNGRYYYDDMIHSLDGIDSSSGQYVAVGTDYDMSVLRVYR